MKKTQTSSLDQYSGVIAMNRLFYAIRQAIKQMHRNKGMTFASLFAITAMLLILGMFLSLIININTAAESVKQDYNHIEIFLQDSVKDEQIDEMMQEVASWKGVADVGKRTKEEALTILKVRWGKNAYLLENLSTNPLPNSIVITMNELEDSDVIAEKAEKLDGIEDVNYYKNTINKLVKITNIMQIVGFIVIVFLILVSIVVVSNTIKLTVFARSEEIEIMKYVGATNWFVRLPFLVEGVLIGIIAAILSAGIISLVYGKLVDVVGTKLLAMLSSSLVPPSFLTVNLVWICFALGISIGAWGSIISMRRFLRT